MPARSTGESEPPTRRRRESRDFEARPTPARRPRRRRQQAPWLQRNALSIAAVSMLLALLGLGFGLLQFMTRPVEPTNPALLAIEPTVGTTLNAAAIGPSVQLPASTNAGSALVPPAREIQFSARVLDANYTVEAGDTLGRIAVRFNTTVERIQALNNLTDPRTLRIGTKLVIPPPF